MSVRSRSEAAADPVATSSDTGIQTVSMEDVNIDIIDSLPIPPPYISEPLPLTTHNSQRRRSISIEQITNCDDMETQRRKVCCDVVLCKFCLAGCLRFRRVLFMMTSAGLLSIIASVILGAARTLENNFLTLSLMFAGLGIVLLSVVIIGWRCTPSDHEPCHLLFGLGSYAIVPQRPFFGRRIRRSSRFYWFGDRLFPEFRYRRPPPSYAVSMQDYNQFSCDFLQVNHVPATPPPVYKLYNSQRNRARKGVHILYPRLPTDPHCLPPLYRERIGYQSRRHNGLHSGSIELTGEDNQAFQRDVPNVTEPSEDNGQRAASPDKDLVVSDNIGAVQQSVLNETEQPSSSPETSLSNHSQDNFKAKQKQVSKCKNSRKVDQTDSRGDSSHTHGKSCPASKRFYDNLGAVTHL
ncbi:uncharacterized protein [Watersipora subatra]|uniref:uncharacterized protein n=1 Tax=Watersipora subatra TaxID=2589382 RepID=UPI00355BD50B